MEGLVSLVEQGFTAWADSAVLPHSPFRQRKARGLEQREAGGGGDLRACSPSSGVSAVSQL